MKIVGYFHLFPPEHNAGSETTVHSALRAMVNRRHKVQVICDRSVTAPYNIDGIEVVRPPRRGVQSWLENFVKDCDLIVTHLDLTSQAMTLAMAAKKPLVHFVHNDAQLMYWRVDARVPYKNSLTVFNSHWLANQPSSWAGQDMPETWMPPHHVTVHPVVEPEKYRCERGEAITLVNPTSGKGAETFYRLANLMPERQFITAQGGYGIQEACKPQNKALLPHTFYNDHGDELSCHGLPNVTHLRNDPDIRNIFRRTKVLLMPSLYESFGRVGIEAACAGIPTIAHPTTGLVEAFGDAGIFIDREDTDAWFAEVTRLLTDDVYYRKCSQKVLDLADSLDPESEFERLEKALLETAERVNGDINPMMWKSDRWIWRLADNSYKATSDQRIPPGAVVLAYGRGAEVPEDVAIANGWITGKAQQPQENKAVAGPTENKAKSRKKVA